MATGRRNFTSDGVSNASIKTPGRPLARLIKKQNQLSHALLHSCTRRSAPLPHAALDCQPYRCNARLPAPGFSARMPTCAPTLPGAQPPASRGARLLPPCPGARPLPPCPAARPPSRRCLRRTPHADEPPFSKAVRRCLR